MPRVYVSRRVQASHGVLHVVLVLRQGKRHEYSARQRGVQKGKWIVQGACVHDWRHDVYGMCPMLGNKVLLLMSVDLLREPRTQMGRNFLPSGRRRK